MNYFTTLILLILAAIVFAAPRADDCETKCKLPDCRCSSTNIPNNLDPANIPQLVLLTFDDAVSVLNHKYYAEAFSNKKNPDGCPIGTTYFVSHEYTDYTVVNEIYQAGHEIALHSISHTTDTKYWKEASVELLNKEFGGERELISKFANIPIEDIHGIRIPFLQMSGNNITASMTELGLEYDCSWPTFSYVKPGMWPYSLDYPSIQDCAIGPCPSDSAPGIWEQPMIDMLDNSGVSCSMADGCVDVPTDVDGVLDFIVRNFQTQYKGNKAPFGLYVHAAWFDQNPHRFEAYKKFLDYLSSLKDVYIVNVHRALQWVKNPSTLDNLKESWPECVKPKPATCEKLVCKLQKGEEERYMTICGTNCPKSYPWLDNPLGE